MDTEKLDKCEEIGEQMGWDPSEVIRKHGAFVKCNDLARSQQLNGKMVQYSKESWRHVVLFEKDDVTVCLVNPGNP